ncbi:MAG TPA: enoyl-CoA hydratase/isomerase family protein [Syntrophomonadaceae bacterium]|nr:enoyl-CoA hydratase/isomerase family protein [Syntrophomonadaceae bacterium]
MQYHSVLVEKESSIAVVTLNRPQALNALTVDLMKEISAAFKELEEDEAVNAVVLTGGIEAFCAGFDMDTVIHGDKSVIIDGFLEAFIRILKFPVPVIAAVTGPALAAGFDLMVMADIRVFSEKVRVGQPEIRWALTPLSDPLWKIIGMGRAKEVTMTGRIYGAQEAKEMGLANFIYSQETFLDEAKNLARKIAAFDRAALKANKEQTNRVPGMEVEAAIRTQLWTFCSFVGSPGMVERMTAFLESNRRK